MEPDTSDRILSALGRIEARLAGLDETEQSIMVLARTIRLRREELQRPRAEEGSCPPHTPVGGNEEEVWLEVQESKVALLMGPFANEQRLKLLKALYLGITESGRLKEFTGLTGGQLYHHLKELALAKFLSRPVRGEYRLSAFGYYAFSALMILVSDLLAEDTEEELVAPDEIGELE